MTDAVDATGFLDREDEHRDRKRGWNHGTGEHRADVPRENELEGYGDERSGKGTDGVKRLTQPEGRAANPGRRDIGDQGYASSGGASTDFYPASQGKFSRTLSRPICWKCSRVTKRGKPAA
ncbi:hypothetical protein [Brevundimonas sp.]|uniref:hypothetical protein n=1 Tax=Brevundimonas sp. TaxID=1871086 RepID=UPI001209758A|nr:hypothetical protein [Brevundimonas sp.]TAJ59786.1 MAG: hypothetical protein EPO49_09900 [Brevundimonas sp.]